MHRIAFILARRRGPRRGSVDRPLLEPAERTPTAFGVRSLPGAARTFLPGQFPILDAVRLVGLGSQPPLAIGFIVLVVALEPDDFAIALERQHMRRDAVQEPAIVAD